MSIIPESIQVGQCYLSTSGKIRRVLNILSDGRVQFEARNRSNSTGQRWKLDIMSVEAFAASTEQPIRCDWVHGEDE
jgi:hypothetical protein